MARYPIKMLKDESGQPFVPLTHVSAVTGEEYTTTTLNAIKQSSGHYKITNEDLSTDLLNGKVIAVKFDNVTNASIPSYLKFNNDAEYPLYQADGINYLVITEYGASVVFLVFINNKWQLLKVATDSSASGGHGITDEEGNIMPQRNIVQFVNLKVEDVPGDGATRITNSNWVKKYVGITGTISANDWVNLLSTTLNAPEQGTYRISGLIALNNLSSVGREIGFRITNQSQEDWFYQYKRCKHLFTTVITVNSGTNITPQIYIDKLTSTDSISISSCLIIVEKLNIKEV